MDDREAYMNMKPIKADSGAHSKDDPNSTYIQLNIREVDRLTNTQTDGLDPTYSQLNFHQNELLIAKDEDPPIASKPGEISVTVQAGPHKQESRENVGNRPDRKICLLCLVASTLIAIVAGLSIYVLQIRQSQIKSDQNYQILCQFLTSDGEQACPQDWMKNEERCYFISTVETSYDGAKNNCSSIHARLLEVNSKEEENVISNALVHQDRSFWIGKCEDTEPASSLMYKNNKGKSMCGTCDSTGWRNHCKRQHRFICEKRAHFLTDIPEKIQDLCQPSLGPK